MRAYYNENDQDACARLSNLMDAGMISPGQIDDRSIVDVQPSDVVGFERCHFFAGIAGWELALELAQWPTEWPVWTGSCPCQPFSVAGRKQAHADKRHLWPEFRRLIAERNPPVVFGEQVASKLGREWLSGVRTDLEDMGYAVGAADLCAASAGAPHIRQRLFWVADGMADNQSGGCGELRESSGCHGLTERGRKGFDRVAEPCNGQLSVSGRQAQERNGVGSGSALSRQTAWSDYALVGPDPKGKYRRVAESAICGMVDGLPAAMDDNFGLLTSQTSGRLAKLRGLGNAIVPQVAASFVKAYLPV